MSESMPTPIAELSYEAARAELESIVTTLERTANLPLEQALDLWERGEALVDHCNRWLDGARARVEARVNVRTKADSNGQPDF